MKIIYTKKGEEIFVDDEDYERLNAFPWHIVQGYAMRHARLTSDANVEYKQSMHRQIFGLEYGDPPQVDHRNSNRLDNQRKNLRMCSAGQNTANTGLRCTNSSGFKGIYWNKRDERWMARIRKNGKRLFLGLYSTAEEAHAAYVKAAREIYGDFYIGV